MTIKTFVIFMVIFVFSIFFIVFIIDQWLSRLRKRWGLIAEGIYSKAIHRKIKTRYKSMIISTIFLKDGRTIPVLDIYEFPPSGTHIIIYKNPLGEFKIKTAV